MSENPIPKRKKHATYKRKPRTSPNGAGSIFQVPRKRKDGTVRMVWRAVEYITDPYNKSVRVEGEGSTPKIASDALYNNKNKRLVAWGLADPQLLHSAPKKTARNMATAFDELIQQRINQGHEPQTVSGYENKIRIYLKPKFGARIVGTITAEELEDYFTNELPNIRKPNGELALGGTSQRQVYFILNATFKRELGLKNIYFNPLEAVPAPRRTQTKQAQKTKINQSKWIPEYLLQHLQGTQQELRWMLAFLGLRQSEVLGLTDDCFKRRKAKDRPGILVIEKQLARINSKHGCGEYDEVKRVWACGRKANNCPQKIGEAKFYLKDAPKTASGYRQIPIYEPTYSLLVQAIEEQKKLRASKKFEPAKGPGLDKLIFTTARGKPISHGDDRTAWKKLLELNKVDKPLRLHDARALAVTLMLEQGLSHEKLGLIFGWSPQTVAYMVKTYASPSASYVSEDMKTMTEALTKRQKKK